MPGSRLRQPPSSEGGLRRSGGFAGLSVSGRRSFVAKAASPGMTSLFAGTPTNFKQPAWPTATASRSRRACARVLPLTFRLLKSEGAGNAGRSLRPQPRVRKIKKHTSIVTTVTPESPGIPRAMVLTASFELSPVIGLSCHRRLQVTTCKLDAGVEASGPHDFAVRETSALVSRAAHVHRIPPRVRDDREPPLRRGGTGRACKDDLPDGESGIFFQLRLDR